MKLYKQIRLTMLVQEWRINSYVASYSVIKLLSYALGVNYQ